MWFNFLNKRIFPNSLGAFRDGIGPIIRYILVDVKYMNDSFNELLSPRNCGVILSHEETQMDNFLDDIGVDGFL